MSSGAAPADLGSAESPWDRLVRMLADTALSAEEFRTRVRTMVQGQDRLSGDGGAASGGSGASAASSSAASAAPSPSRPAKRRSASRGAAGEDDDEEEEADVLELSSGCIRRAWDGGELFEDGQPLVLQVVSHDRYAETRRARVQGQQLEVVRKWVTLSDGEHLIQRNVEIQTRENTPRITTMSQKILFIKLRACEECHGG